MKAIKKSISVLLVILITFSTVAISCFNSSAVITLTGIDGYLTNQLYARGLTALSEILGLIGNANPEIKDEIAFINKWVCGNGGGTSIDDVKEICEEILSTVTDIKSTTENIESLENAAVITDTAKAYEEAWENQVNSVINSGNGNESLQNVFDAYVDYLSYACESKELTRGRTLEYYEGLYNDALIDLCARNAKSNYIDPTTDRSSYYSNIMYTTDVIDTIIKSTLTSLINYLEYDAKGNRYIDKAALLAYYAMPFSTQQADFIDAAMERQLNTITIVIMIYQDFLSRRAEYYSELNKKSVEGYKTMEECNQKYAVYNKMYQSVLDMFSDEVSAFVSSPVCLNNGYIYATSNLSAYMREDSFLSDDGNVQLVNTTFKKSHGVNKFQTYATFSQDLHYNKNACVKIKDNKLTFIPFYILNGEMLSNQDRLLKTFNYVEEEPFEMSDWVINDIYWPTCDYYNIKDGVYSDGVNKYRTISDVSELKEIINETSYSAYKHNPYTYFANFLEFGSNNPMYLVLRKGVDFVNTSDFKDRYHRLPLLNMKSTGGFSTEWKSEYVSQPDFSSQMYAQILICDSNNLYSKVETKVIGSAEVSISGVTDSKAVSGTTSELNITAPEGNIITKVTVKYHNDASNPQTVTGEKVISNGVLNNSLTMDMDIPYSNITVEVETQKALAVDEKGNFLIGSYAELMQMFEMINSGNPVFTKGSYKLTQNIDCNRNNAFSAEIDVTNGEEDVCFNGRFNGDNYTISALGMGLYYLDEDERRPLFDILGENAVVENLRISCASLMSEVDDASAMGIICSENNGVIKNCMITNSHLKPDDAEYVGGFAGINNGVIENCGVTFTGFEKEDSKLHGGITALNNGEVKNCFSFMCQFIDSNNEENGPVIANGNNPENCYFYTTYAVNKSFGTEKTYDQFFKGEVTYLLNNGVTDGTQAFYQDLADADYPTIFSNQTQNKTVYKTESGKYTN